MSFTSQADRDLHEMYRARARAFEAFHASIVRLDPEQRKALAQTVFSYAKAQLPANLTDPRADLEAVLRDAHDLVEVERQAERAAELSARIIEQQAAEQARRDKLTDRDPEVIAAMDQLRRLNSSELSLLREADNISPAQRVAVDLIIRERAAEKLDKLTSTSGASSGSAAAE
jgi:hypothetical protein